MSIVDKAGEAVASKTPHVMEALRKIRFLIIGIPLIGVAIGVLGQAIIPERDVASASFKVGSFTVPGSSAGPVPLASETQMRTRLRNIARELRKKFKGAYLLHTSINNDVVVLTATGLGIEDTKSFLNETMQREISRHNNRLSKLSESQVRRRQLLETELGELGRRLDQFNEAQKNIDVESEGSAWFALLRSRADAKNRINAIKLELNHMELVAASDLFIDTSAIIEEPLLIARSQWYRPVLFGVIGLGAGALLTLILAVVAVIRALSRRSGYA